MPDITEPAVAHVIADGLPTARSTSYMLHLPLYNGVVSGKIGAWSEDGTARIGRLTQQLAPAPDAPAVIWYGTSILQGAMAARPGHQFSNTVSRELGVEIFNEGFSASGTMELSVAAHLVAIKKRRAAVYIIDCIWNMNPLEVSQRTGPLVRFLQANGTRGAAVVLVEGSEAGLGWASNTTWPGRNPGNVALRAAYERLAQAGTRRLHYVSSSELYARAALYGGAGDVTMGGVHPGDVGTRATAEFWIGFLPTLMPWLQSAGG